MIEVRRATIDDAAALARLRWLWRVDERGERASSGVAFAERFRGWMIEHHETHRAFVAHDGADPIGMAWLAVVTRVPGPQVWRRLAGIVQSVYVVPDQRNAGIGERLVCAVIDDARALSIDYLMVHPSERSFSLYRRVGFAESGGVLELALNP